MMQVAFVGSPVLPVAEPMPRGGQPTSGLLPEYAEGSIAWHPSNKWSLVAAASAGCCIGASARRSSGRRNGAARGPTVATRAVDMPVKEAPVETTIRLTGTELKEEVKQRFADQYVLILHNDPVNKREYVSRCLMQITGLTESKAYQVMMEAHKLGKSLIGMYKFEDAEAYEKQLTAKNLIVTIEPVDNDDA
eukprot:CAMPEP_0178427950 /NCGR_PEP_ID=MMETSP0689_2-20121128/30017_1 /TAXON_ID=160604 /ORGANISM="Amphidinium massartii, Strain CS-259" /LENGTH=191 /DNA_ID=CAMNT_0020049689 /DNA_START=102 /DNA_END=677 /DNA_ORIENTATION=+